MNKHRTNGLLDLYSGQSRMQGSTSHPDIDTGLGTLWSSMRGCSDNRTPTIEFHFGGQTPADIEFVWGTQDIH